jgi:hypothetical protein
MALPEAYKEVEWIRGLLKELHYGDHDIPTVLNTDNKGTLNLAYYIFPSFGPLDDNFHHRKWEPRSR